MDKYARAKKKLFEYVLKNTKTNKYAVFPKDDPYGRAWFEDMPFDKKISYGVYSSAMLKAENILAALSVCVEIGVDITQAIQSLQSFVGVPGRLEEVKHKDVLYYIDFAHSPDALEKTLTYQIGRASCRERV